jgi:hypothetical protein
MRFSAATQPLQGGGIGMEGVASVDDGEGEYANLAMIEVAFSSS